MLHAYVYTVQSRWLRMAWHREDASNCCGSLTRQKYFLGGPHFLTILFFRVCSVFILSHAELLIPDKGKKKKPACDGLHMLMTIFLGVDDSENGMPLCLCKQLTKCERNGFVIVVTKCGPCLPFIYLCVHFHDISLLLLLHKERVAACSVSRSCQFTNMHVHKCKTYDESSKTKHGSLFKCVSVSHILPECFNDVSTICLQA